MTHFFQNISPRHQKSKGYSQKSKGFRQEIRSKALFQRIRQKRIVGNDGPHLESMVKGLPLSWHDTVQCMKEFPQYCQSVTKMIIDRVFPLELSDEVNHDEKSSVNFLLPSNAPETFEQFKQEVYFFAILIENQINYSPNIFKRYLLILLEHGRSVNGLHLMFNLFVEVLKQPDLNWAPIEEIIETLAWIQKSQKQKQKQFPVSQIEVQTYFHLVSNDFYLVEKVGEIRSRIKAILESGVDNLENVKPNTFFKLCFQLTHFENFIKEDNPDSKNQKSAMPERFFHEAMLKGGLIKALFRQIFTSSKEKLKYLCLDILSNLMIEYDGMILWENQAIDPIALFDDEIRDENNTMNLFMQFCSVFLTSILELPCHKIMKIFGKQTDSLELVFYILEKINGDLAKGREILERAQQCIYFILKEGNREIQQKISQILLQNRWKMVLGPESDLIYECEKRAKLQP